MQSSPVNEMIHVKLLHFYDDMMWRTWPDDDACPDGLVWHVIEWPWHVCDQAPATPHQIPQWDDIPPLHVMVA